MSVVPQSVINKALSGDTQAVTSLIIAFIPIIRSRIFEGNPDGLETDDLLQEGLIGLLRALSTFDTSAGVKFTTYATVCIDNHIISALKRAGRKKHSILNGSMPLEDQSEDVLTHLEDQVETREMVRVMQDAIQTRLTPLERRVLSCFLDGLSYDETAQKLSITRKAVDNGMQRVRRKLKQ